ncbi:MAG: C-terminal helicase domain-containing protein, partial [Raoultibacter sp.]
MLNAFFSSPWAFSAKVKEFVSRGLIQNEGIIFDAQNWLKSEEYIIEHIVDILDDPGEYAREHCSRLCSVLNLLYDELYDQKVVLFTNDLETFKAYRTALSITFKEKEISFFGSDMEMTDLEANAFRFQNEQTCRIMLCDYTGGEGRNFQCADFIVHIDLPWDASLIEQRIGRLDRLERDPERSTVTSVVVYAQDTFEASLFSFFRQGLRIFEQSLSGMEIIMTNINREIFSAVHDDFRYGLSERIPAIIQSAEKMREEIRKEQSYDAAGFVFKPMYAELRRLIEYYTKNENDIFANAMTEWASLAGFHGCWADDGIITYDATSFSPKSAINSLLLPPKWVDYISSAQNQFMSQVSAFQREKDALWGKEQFLSGTFIRKQAIENDYLHFFAPGDAIFECITTNAIQSCKGRACAVYAPTGIDWKGFVFTWSQVANEAFLFEHGVSMYAMSPYRHYMMLEQVVTVVSIDNPEDVSDASIIREYTQIANSEVKKKNYTHLGMRGSRSSFLKGHITARSNQSWFRQEYAGESWRELVLDARKEAQKKAAEQFKRRSNLRGAR